MAYRQHLTSLDWEASGSFDQRRRGEGQAVGQAPPLVRCRPPLMLESRAALIIICFRFPGFRVRMWACAEHWFSACWRWRRPARPLRRVMGALQRPGVARPPGAPEERSTTPPASRADRATAVPQSPMSSLPAASIASASVLSNASSIRRASRSSGRAEPTPNSVSGRVPPTPTVHFKARFASPKGTPGPASRSPVARCWRTEVFSTATWAEPPRRARQRRRHLHSQRDPHCERRGV